MKESEVFMTTIFYNESSTKQTRRDNWPFHFFWHRYFRITALLTMGGRKKAFRKTITVNVIFNDVSGLQKGNNIWFAGIEGGNSKKDCVHG